MANEFKLNRRASDRYSTSLMAKYFIKNKSMRFEDCTVIDLSRTGAGIEFPSGETLTEGAEIFIELTVPDGFEQLHVKGTIQRVDSEQSVGGVRFCETLDKHTYFKLVAHE